MRVRLPAANRKTLFELLIKNGDNLSSIARRHGVSPRAMRDWRRGKYLIPRLAFKNLCADAEANIDDLAPAYLEDFWNARTAASLGGHARMRSRGDFGTPEGRRRGGLASIASQTLRHTRFINLKSITIPQYSDELAECLGVFIGDGHLSHYQASVTTNSETDLDHAEFVQTLIENLFGITTSLKYKRDKKAVTVVASSKKLVEYLHTIGMPLGNKIRNGLCVPPWVMEKTSRQESFLRGLFDTDGCLYLDTHRIRSKTYTHFGWTITSYAVTLIHDVLRLLENLGFSPTNRDTQRSVYLRRQGDIVRYFEKIGTHNSKHERRYRTLKLGRGRVPKWS